MEGRLLGVGKEATLVVVVEVVGVVRMAVVVAVVVTGLSASRPLVFGGRARIIAGVVGIPCFSTGLRVSRPLVVVIVVVGSRVIVVGVAWLSTGLRVSRPLVVVIVVVGSKVIVAGVAWLSAWLSVSRPLVVIEINICSWWVSKIIVTKRRRGNQ